jgi:hypothetical protein
LPVNGCAALRRGAMRCYLSLTVRIVHAFA